MEEEKKEEMLDFKTWEEFRETGLLLFINQIIHVFGWAIALNIDEDGKVLDVAPARTKFRGFGEKNVGRSYLKISKYLKENIDELLKEAEE